MKVKQLFIFFFTLILTGSCGNRPKERHTGSEYIAVDIQQAKDIPYMSNIEQIELIPLTTNDSCVIGLSHIVRVSAENIFIVDDRSQEIFVFSISGKFICKISKTGQGPEEYIRIDDLRIHPQSNNIVILDGMQNKILEYTKSGIFVSEKKLPFKLAFKRFSYEDHFQLVFDKGIPFDEDSLQNSVFILPENLEHTTKLFPYKEASHFFLSPRQTIQNVQDTLYYLPIYDQTLYRITDNRALPQYTYSFGKQDMDKSFFFNYSLTNPFQLLKDLESSQSVYFFNINISTDQLFADFLYKGTPYFHVYDLKDKSQRLFYDKTMKDCQSTIIPLTVWEDKFVSLARPDQLDLLPGYAPDNQTPDEQDNPVVIKYKFKKN